MALFIIFTINNMMNVELTDLLFKYIKDIIDNDGSHVFFDDRILKITDILKTDFDCIIIKSINKTFIQNKETIPLYSVAIYCGLIHKLTCQPQSENTENNYEKFKTSLEKYNINIKEICSSSKLHFTIKSHILKRSRLSHSISDCTLNFEEYKNLVEKHVQQLKTAMTNLHIESKELLFLLDKDIDKKSKIINKGYLNYAKSLNK